MEKDFKKYKKTFTEKDRLAKLLGIEILEVSLGQAKLAMKVEEMHLNGADVLHGGAIFTLADTAFAVASNSHEKLSLAVSASITFLKATPLGETIYATAKELSTTRKTGHYLIEITNSKEELISSFTGTVYRTEKIVYF